MGIGTERSVSQIITSGVQVLTEGAVSGEFQTRRALDPDMTCTDYFPSVFVTALIADQLQDYIPGVNDVIRGNLRFLNGNRHQSGFWKFYGANDDKLPPKFHLPPDLDTTACSVIALAKGGYSGLVAGIPEAIKKYQTPDGSFLTWCMDIRPFNHPSKNDVDFVVNTNAARALGLMGAPDPELIDYLIWVLGKGAYEKGTQYYNSPLIFTYFMSRGDMEESLPLESAHRKILTEFVLDQQRALLERSDPLELALAAGTILQVRETAHRRVETMCDRMLKLQCSDGSFPNRPFFVSPRGEYFGSKELTTAISIGVLANWRKSACL